MSLRQGNRAVGRFHEDKAKMHGAFKKRYRDVYKYLAKSSGVVKIKEESESSFETKTIQYTPGSPFIIYDGKKIDLKGLQNLKDNKGIVELTMSAGALQKPATKPKPKPKGPPAKPKPKPRK